MQPGIQPPLLAPRRGSTLVLAMLVMLTLSVLGLGLLEQANGIGVSTSQAVAAAQAFWTAEAGMEHLKFLGQQTRLPFPSVHSPTSSSGLLWGTNALSGATANGTYRVDVLDDPAWTNATQVVKKYIISAQGTSANGTVRTIRLAACMQSFATYMHASESENGISFGPGDVLDGPVYTNDRLSLYGGTPNPLFKQRAWSAASSVKYSNGADSSSFSGGLVLNAPTLDIAGQFSSDHILDVKNQASHGGLVLASPGTYVLNFMPNGQFTSNLQPTGPLVTNRIAAISNGTMFVNGDVQVQGVVSGKLSMAVSGSIYLTSNLVYCTATNPTPWSTSFNPARVTDSLGLVASNRVEVTGESEITIEAAILVTAGGFDAFYYSQSFGSPHINLYGSISQYSRGAVGRIGGYGFLKNYKYDSRLSDNAPPGFPYSLYAFTRWSASR